MVERDAPARDVNRSEPADGASIGRGFGAAADQGDGFDQPCPACGNDLMLDEGFAELRVCSACRRHFSLTGRERIALLVDTESFVETNAALVSVDPLVFHDRLPFPDRLAETGDRSDLPDAVITGTARVGGQDAVLIALDSTSLGGSIGVVAGERIVLAMELALTRRLPLVALCSGGAARTQMGMLSLVQLAKTTAAATRLHRAGVPFLAVLAHPTTGGVYAGVANQADVILAEPGAQIGLRASNRDGIRPGAGTNTAEFLLDHGLLDVVLDRSRLRETIAALLGFVGQRGNPHHVAPRTSHGTGGTAPRAWEAVGVARHPERPTSLDYIRRFVTDFVELHGDRVGGDDPAMVCGFGRLDGLSVAVIAQERGRGDEIAHRHAGRTDAAGYRKAARVMRLASHFELPIVTMIDTPGAASGTEAEAEGIGVALSQILGLMSMVPVPIVSVVIGEGGGLGALALSVADRILMMERAVYSMPGPEQIGAHLYRASDRAAEAAPSLKLTANDCQRLGVVDVVVREPDAGAHADADGAARALRGALVEAIVELRGTGSRRLVNERARRVRYLGQTTPEGRAAARHEVRELEELQRTLARSLHDLRDRWEGRTRGRPRLNLHRPDLTDLATRLTARRSPTEAALAARDARNGAASLVSHPHVSDDESQP